MRKPDWDQWDRAIIEELPALETFNVRTLSIVPRVTLESALTFASS